VLARLEDPKSRLRTQGSDYLVFRLVDVTVDSFFPHLERLASSSTRSRTRRSSGLRRNRSPTST
jgi:Mg2+ and Co2+ transporter CorA